MGVWMLIRNTIHTVRIPLEAARTKCSRMQFLRVSSTIKMPETVPLQTEKKLNVQITPPNFASDKLSLFDTASSSIPERSKQPILNALRKRQSSPEASTDRSSTQPQKKASDIITKFRDLIESNKAELPLVSSIKVRERSLSLPNIKTPLSALLSKADTAQKLNEIDLIGHVFSPNQLMFSDSLQKSADKYGVVIGVRFPSEVGQLHLKEGHPTKNFHVKAKSSTTGPTAGFIAENPKYSKVAPAQWERQGKYINEAMSKGAQSVPLTLSSTQIENAIHHGGMTLVSGNVYAANYHGENVHFTINPPDNLVRELNGNSVRVLTNPPESNGVPLMNKAITADYDLFSIVTKDNQSNNFRQLKVGHNVRLNNKEKQAQSNENVNDYLQSGGVEAFNHAVSALIEPKTVHGKEDLDKGNVHFYGETIINDINKNVEKEGYTGGKLVWHGDETGNPYSPGFDLVDKPVFFIPGHPPQQIKNMKELVAFYKELKRHGYTPESSAKLGL